MAFSLQQTNCSFSLLQTGSCLFSPLFSTPGAKALKHFKILG